MYGPRRHSADRRLDYRFGASSCQRRHCPHNRNQVFIAERFLRENQNVRIVVWPLVKTQEKCLNGQSKKVLRVDGNILAVDGMFRGFDALSKDSSQ